MILDAFRLDGRVALVTGASRGLGAAMAVALAEAGADVVGLDRCSSDETRSAVGATGRRYLQVCCDLAETPVDRLRGIVADVKVEMGPVHILVNNAGIIRRAPALEFSEADWDDVMQVNLRAVFFLSQAVARGMAERGSGKIINIASMLSFQGGILAPSYTASKSGVAGLTRALANEWAPHGINVNAIAPGYMATDNTAPIRADAARAQGIVDRIPAGRWGSPADAQGAVVFLASRAADYVNGAILCVDGGWMGR